MAIGSLAPSAIGPASAQPLTIETQYRRTQLKESLKSLRQAYVAGDAPTVATLSSNIRAMASGAGISQPELSRILQDVANPGPNSLQADIDYMTALTDEDSVLSPTTKQTYSRDDLDAMNAPPPNPGIGSVPDSGSPFGSPSPAAPAQISPSTGVATSPLPASIGQGAPTA